MYCVHCGKEIDLRWKYCPFCGFEQDRFIQKQEAIQQLSEAQRELFENLKQERVKLAEHKGVPPFIIAHDSLLIEICKAMPTTEEELLKIKGIRKRKLEWIKDLLPTIQKFKNSLKRLGKSRP